MIRILIALILFSSVCRAQSVVLDVGENTFVVAGTYYPLNTIALSTTDNDTTLAGMIALPGRAIVTLMSVSNFKRSDGVAFESRHALIAFFDSFAVGGSSPSPSTCLSSCEVTTSVTVTGGGYPLHFVGFSHGYITVGNGTSYSAIVSEDGNNIAAVVIDDVYIFLADSSTQTSFFGYDVTGFTANKIEGAIYTESPVRLWDGVNILTEISGGTFSGYSEDAAAGVELKAKSDGSENYLKFFNSGGQVILGLATSGTTLNCDLPEYLDNAAAAAVLAVNDWYFNTTIGAFTKVTE